MNKKRNIFLIVLAVAIAVFVIKGKKNNTVSTAVDEINPSYGSIDVVISTTGIVEPQNRLEIKPPINGRVEEILVKEGEKVKSGQILAWMSSTERAALIDAARMQDEKMLEHWQDVYRPTPLIAPIDGEVIVRAVEPGQTVSSSDTVIVISDRLIVKAQVDETDIGKVKIGQSADISLDAYPHIKVNATVDHISYESTTVNNVTIYEVDILPEKIPDVFRSGMSANVNIVEKHKANILIIPVEAVGKDKNGSYVMVREGLNSVRRKVELGISDEKNVEITSGLQETDKVLVKVTKYTLSKATDSGSNPLMPFGRKKR